MNSAPIISDYHSPARKIGRAARAAPEAFFYLKLLKIVLSAGRTARRGEYTGEQWIQSSRLTLAALESVGITVSIENTASFINLPSPCVLAGNHMSILETFLLPGIIQPHRDVTFVVKESLLAYPFFGCVLSSRNPIVVSRRNPRQDLEIVLREGEKRLRRGTSIILFPQTTRSPVFSPGEFNSLGVKLARRAGAPVIPIAIKTDAWGTGKWVKDLGKISPRIPVHITFGDPIPVTGSGRGAQERIIRFISGRLGEWEKLNGEDSTLNVQR
ncbi:MAG: lysophospholipid acyltransferase family protein [PVC group bacterium]